MLVDAVIVTSNRPGADIDPLPDTGIADVAQVWNLGPFADDRLLNLHEVSNLGPLVKLSVGPQVRVGPDLAPVTDLALLDNAPIKDNGAIAHRRIPDPAA